MKKLKAGTANGSPVTDVTLVHGENVYLVHDDRFPSGVRTVVDLYFDPDVEPTLTQVHMQEETDINSIVAKFIKTGVLPQFRPGQYGDFSEPVDLHSALNTIREADNAFAQVPADIRRRFNDDPANFFNFVNDPKNVDDLISMGLASRAEVKPDLVGAIDKVTQAVVESRPKKKKADEE